MKGKTVVITGGTSGIGLAAAHALARRGARLVVVGRDPDKAEATLVTLRRVGPEADHAIHLADLSSVADTARVGAVIAASEPRIDVLANNAGAVFDRRIVTSEGFEKTFALNHLGYAGLTEALRGSLEAAAPSRIVNTSSIAHRFGRLDWADLQNARRYRGMMVYCQSKLLNILFTRELARRLAGTGVTANCFHPGFVASRFGDESTGPMRSLFGLGKSLFAISPKQGAETLIHLAASPTVEGQTGGYYVRSKRAELSKAAQDDAAARRLWDTTAVMIANGHP